VTILSGFDVYAHWYIVQSKYMYRELVKYTYQKAILSVIVLGILICSSWFTLPLDVFYLTLILCIPVLTGIFSAFIFVVQYQKKAKIVSIAMVTSALLLLVFKISAVYLQLPLSIFVAINSLDGVVLACTAVYFLYTVMRSDSQDLEYVRVTFSGLVVLCKNSVYPLIYIVFWFIVIRVDQFIVPLYFNAYSLGIYSSAVKVVEMTNVFIVILQAIVLPRILHINNPIGNKKNTHIAIMTYFIFGCITAFTISLCAPYVVHILFGSEFNEATKLLQIYSWSIPGLFVSYLFAVILMSRRSFKLLAAHAGLLTVISVSLLYIVIPYLQLQLIAYVSVMVYTFSAIGYYILWRKPLFLFRK